MIKNGPFKGMSFHFIPYIDNYFRHCGVIVVFTGLSIGHANICDPPGAHFRLLGLASANAID